MWHKTLHQVHSEPAFLFEIDDWRDGDRQMVFMHLRVMRFSPQVMRRMRDVFAAFRAVVACPLFAIGEEDSPKWERFISHFGFRYLTDVICENGERRRLFVNYKNNENAQQRQ